MQDILYTYVDVRLPPGTGRYQIAPVADLCPPTLPQGVRGAVTRQLRAAERLLIRASLVGVCVPHVQGADHVDCELSAAAFEKNWRIRRVPEPHTLVLGVDHGLRFTARVRMFIHHPAVRSFGSAGRTR